MSKHQEKLATEFRLIAATNLLEAEEALKHRKIALAMKLARSILTSSFVQLCKPYTVPALELVKRIQKAQKGN